MIASERQRKILDYVNAHINVTTASLCDVANASIATIRRDLNYLNSKGLLSKTHGGAQALSSEQQRESPDFNIIQKDPYYNLKDQNALIAAELIRPGDIIFIGAGTTCTLLARYIRHIENITIVTTSINAVLELSTSKTASMLLLGGDIHVGPHYIETLSEATLESISKFYFNKVFFTVDGVDLEYGYSIINRSQLPLYNYLLNNCAESFLFIDESKLNKRTFTHLRPLDSIKNVISAAPLPAEYKQYYNKRNISIYTNKDEPEK